MKMNFGVATGRALRIDEIPRHAQVAEECGFSYLGFVDQPSMDRDVHVMMAVAALHTRRIGVGHSVTDPWTLHPWVVANATATIDELSGGRAFLGIGAGGPFGKTMTARPIDDLREAVLFLRRYMAGEEAEFKGVRMRSEWIRRQVPIYMACEGPRACRLAGELADGVVTARPNPIYTKWKLEQIEKGALAVGRDPSTIDVRVISQVYVTDTKEAALRESAGYAVNVHRTYQLLQSKSTEVADLRRRIERAEPGLIDDMRLVHDAWTPDQHEKIDTPSAKLVTSRVSDFVDIIGPLEHVTTRIEELGDLGVKTIECAVYTIIDKEGMMRRLRDEVMPRFFN
jgi:5,10-methylenetetrahydromethanopterin reductase